MRQGFFAAGGGFDLMPVERQHHADGIANVRFIVHHENLARHNFRLAHNPMSFFRVFAKPSWTFTQSEQ